ncbi:lysozyme [Psychrobacter sp. AOP7-A1-24]|uniref:lysozyme n=1 Tax=Psychrobacter sp. AOP7-A1-24 TaxID=3457646 RepID=UPI00402B821B
MISKDDLFVWARGNQGKGYLVQSQVDGINALLLTMTPQAVQDALSKINGWLVKSNRVMSDKGIELLKDSEGLRLKAYQDTGGVWTIGYGHTSAAGGMKVYPGLTITRAQAEQLLRDDLARMTYPVIDDLVKVPLTQGQFDALCSFIYNLGATQVSTSTLLKRLNQGKYNEAASQFKRWKYDNGVVQKGLVIRRAKEEALFLS